MDQIGRSLHRPTHRLRTWLLASGLLLVGLTGVGLSIRSPIGIYDEGLALENASRVLAGRAPYRDFWTIYAPGQYYAEAGLMAVLGENVIVTRLYDTLVRLLILACVYRLSSILAGGRWALAASIVALAWLGSAASAGFQSYTIFPALLLALLTLLCFTRYLGRRQARWLWAAGVGLGLTAVFRQDFGAYAAVGLGLTLLLIQWPRGRGQNLAQAMTTLFTGAAVAAVPAFAWQGLASGLSSMYQSLVVKPVSIQPVTRHLPYPNPLNDLAQGLRYHIPQQYLVGGALLGLLFYCAAPVYVLCLARWVRGAGHRSSAQSPAIVPSAVTGGLMFVQELNRADMIHLLPTALYLTLCLV